MGLNPRLEEIATTGRAFCAAAPAQGEPSNFFHQAQWSPDGTCILTQNADQTLRTFVLPPDLLTQPQSEDLRPYAVTHTPEPVYSYTPYPFFHLPDARTTLLLTAVRDHPIRLTNALLPSSDPSSRVASYPLVNPLTEAVITPNSLLFTPSGTHFIAGSLSQIARFDVSQSGGEPVERTATIPSKRSKLVGGGVGMKGIVSALSLSADGLLAAGTFSRFVGLYGAEGRGEQVAVFGLESDVKGDEDADRNRGRGITGLRWSSCGRYLYVAERAADTLQVYDVRVSGRRLAWCEGRRAMTNQRLAFDLVPTADGDEVWAGGVDGVVRIWRNVAAQEGPVGADSAWEAHNDPVSSAIVHSSGSVVATCSGQRGRPSGVHSSSSSDSDTEVEVASESSGSEDARRSVAGRDGSAPDGIDNTLRVWSIH